MWPRWARSDTPPSIALFYVAAHRTSALNLSIIQGAIPALVLIGARLFLGVRFTALQAVGALSTMVGVAAIAAQGDLARLAALASTAATS